MLRRFNRLAMLAALALIVLAVTLSVAALAGTRLGYQALLMTTGSMRPAVNPGDLVILRSVDPADIRVGDVITFREPVGSHLLVTHRVVAIAATPDGPVFRTKGDANAVADIWTLNYQDRGWREAGVIPGVGRAIAFVQTIPGRLLVVLVVFALALGVLTPAGPGRRAAPGEAAA